VNYHSLAQRAKRIGLFNTASFIFMISKMSTSAPVPLIFWSCFGVCALQASCFDGVFLLVA